MSYLEALSGIFGKRSIWLYHFRRDGVEWFMTSRATELVEPIPDFFGQLDFFGGGDFFNRTWEPTPIVHSKFKVTTSTKRAEVSFVLPQSNEMASEYFKDSYYTENAVTIYHEFTTDPDAERIVKFRGRVVASKSALTRITLVAENKFTELRRKGLSAVTQRPCRHALYHSVNGIGCGAVLDEWQDDALCLSVDGYFVTFDDALGRADGYYSGGIISIGSRKQMIVSHSGDQLKLLAPVAGLSESVSESGGAGVSIKIAPGCNLTRENCALFGQILNFGGFPWMDDTPYNGASVF